MVACWITDHYHPCSNLGVGMSEGHFIFDFTSLPLEVAQPIQPTLCTKVAIYFKKVLGHPFRNYLKEFNWIYSSSSQFVRQVAGGDEMFIYCLNLIVVVIVDVVVVVVM